MEPLEVRVATLADAPELLEIYRPFVENTAVSFEVDAPDLPAFEARMHKALAGWQWLVAQAGEEILGYAYGSMHRDRPAYRWSVEVSAYVRADSVRCGIGRSLYRQLLPDLAARGFCNAFAGVTLPNEASVGMHSAMGFEPIGVFRSVGRKFGSWHDVAWFQRKLRDQPPAGEDQ